MANSASVRLEKVRTAIDNLLDGGAVQSYSIGGRDLSHYSLSQLMELERRLVAQVNSEKTDRRENYIRFENPK